AWAKVLAVSACRFRTPNRGGGRAGRASHHGSAGFFRRGRPLRRARDRRGVVGGVAGPWVPAAPPAPAHPQEVKMMVAVTQSLDAGASPPSQSLRALDAINFFIAALLAGFGPFIALFLSSQAWSATNIGYILSVGSGVALVAQLPGGELLDAIRS